jgi:hypothetical protein
MNARAAVALGIAEILSALRIFWFFGVAWAPLTRARVTISATRRARLGLIAQAVAAVATVVRTVVDVLDAVVAVAVAVTAVAFAVAVQTATVEVATGEFDAGQPRRVDPAGIAAVAAAVADVFAIRGSHHHAAVDVQESAVAVERQDQQKEEEDHEPE